MSETVEISSAAQLNGLLSSSRVVVVNFYNEADAASRAISTIYDQLGSQLSRPNSVTFSKVNVEQQKHIAQSYNITNPPTFVIFKNGRQISKVNGANPQQLSDAIKRLANEAEADQSSRGGASSSSGGSWLGASLPRGYHDISDQVDIRGLDLLNSDSEFGGVRTLFETTAPSSAAKGKGTASGSESKKDWVESDVDEQLMLYIPFTSTVKVHTIQLTSLPPKDNDDDIPLRPKTIHLYTNRQHNLGFEEAEDIPATQIIELKASDWDDQTGTAKLELRFVKFQNISSLVLFVVDGDGSGERTRIDRIRIVGEAGEKRDMGKLEKIGDDS
ncbi:DUF1000-domain-containing protein [Westerdykella ornata]|uniref:DUF1000-domain-containing protein n=1 Tax=Westerdykella ornata TaxID=318751 RepID=A0A6A6JYM6_WESOR|nr:DUF1000-domain-containing protein [Westerdykella ornata]KAF2280856.1 DUF1000-domain-containing protein [Westerdykella ornata]